MNWIYKDSIKTGKTTIIYKFLPQGKEHPSKKFESCPGMTPRERILRESGPWSLGS